MNEGKKFELAKIALLALKIGVGGSLAYYIAELLNLEFASSAGIIALLTLQTTKWETFRLSLRRLVTYFFTFGLCMILCHIVRTSWVDYGIYLFCIVFYCEVMGWRTAISVNAVTAAHFLSTQDFSYEFMVNELLLVVIGISVAIILNLYHINDAHENGIIKAMRQTEEQMKKILKELSGYLRHQSMGDHVWEDLVKLEGKLHNYIKLAHEYQDNTFVSHPEYYVNYFEMRMQQCGILHNLHAEMRRIRDLPKQAKVVSDYIMGLCEYVTETNYPQKQITELEEILNEMKNEPLPQTRTEFENRALLYHVMMDLEEFLVFKKRFVESIDEEQLEIYWKNREINKEFSCEEE